jgi:hypothetical protein
MKARVQQDNQSLTKLCRGCFDVRIPLQDALCERCDHIQKLQNFANTIQMLRVTGNADEDGLQLQAVIDCAKTLAKD